jgi:tetratricopeptide (TPR) repeat protein
VYFNGNEAFKEACKSQLENHTENYAEMILMHPVSALPKEKAKSGGPFDKAIEKAVKAIKMHSIQTKPDRKPGKQNDPAYREFMSRTEYNPFLHHAWTLMAKSQFHNGDFAAAAGSFSYISRLYETQPEISAHAKIWKARCYSELGWYYEAEDILSKLNNDQLPKKQINWFSTVYADYLIKQKQYAEAIPYMKIAVESEKNKYQRTREKYLLGQMYAATGQKDLAYRMFGEVAGSTAPYILQLSAEIRRTEVYPGGNIKKMSKRLEKMTRSAKNKEYLDQIYYALGNVYMTVPDTAKAVENYETGVEKSTQGGIAKAMNQIRLGDIYFDLRKYVKAQPNYSEALSQLKKEDEAFPRVSRRSEVLDALVVHVEAVELQDSLLRLSRMTEEERLVVVEKIIADLIKKEEEEKKKAEMDEYLTQQENLQAERQTAANAKRPPQQPVMPGTAGSNDAFYFYNKQAVALGKNAFQQKWGRRKLEDDWRRQNKENPLSDMFANDDLTAETDSAAIPVDAPDFPADSLAGETVAAAGENPALSEDPKDPQYYLQQIPVTEEDIAASNLIVADGLFNMGVIYKDMLEDCDLALETFDSLNTRYPENENKLEAYHHIYLIYWKQDDMATANLYKTKIRDEFPDSDLALAMADPDYEYNQKMMNVIQDSLYQKIYSGYLDGNPTVIREIYGEVSSKYNQSKLMPKFMFINALSFVQTQEPDTFKILLKQLIEKYPNEDVSVLAGEIMKGFQRGLLLGSGDNSLAKSGLFNMRLGTADDALPDSALVFTGNANTPHKLLFIFPKGSLNENMLLFTVASFNFGNFMVNDFGLQKTEINSEIGSLEITGFNNLSEVMQYYKMIHQPSGYAEDLEQPVITVPISLDNYTTLMKGKSLNDYLLFFEEHFSEGSEDLIMRWNLDKEKEKVRLEEQEKKEAEKKEEEPSKAEETEPEEPVVITDSLESIPAVETDSIETKEENTTDEIDEAIDDIYNEATEKVDNLQKVYNEISSDPIRGILNLFKKKSSRNAIDEYARQKEKEEKELAKQRKKERAEKDRADRELARQKEKEQKELLKKQQAEDAALLKAQKKQEKDLAKLKENEKKQREADKKRIAKEKEDARKAAAKLKKEQQKEKDRLRKEAQKAREAERKAKKKNEIKVKNMATIVVDTDNTLNIEQLISSLYMFKGVKRVCLEEDISYPKLDKSISETKSGKNVRCKNVTELMQSLKYRTRHCEPEG